MASKENGRENDTGSSGMKTEKEELEEALEKISERNKFWLWSIFLITAAPGVLNGMHMTSYVFFVRNSLQFHCDVPELKQTGWNFTRVQDLMLPKKTENGTQLGCTYLDLDYASLGNKTYEEAVLLANSSAWDPNAKLKTCEPYNFVYEDKNTVVAEWDLVCDRKDLKSHVQSSFAVGKFFGAFIFGLIADEIGRKWGFTLAATCYVISTLCGSFSSSYGMFLFVRFMIGFGGIGCYGTAYTLLSEIIVGSSKGWVCSLFNVSYPLGMILLAYFAYLTPYWRTLQLIMSVPTLLFPILCWLLPESPHWLLSQGRNKEAWKIVTSIDKTVGPANADDMVNKVVANTEARNEYFCSKIATSFTKFFSMFATWALAERTIITYFIWFSISTTYYGLVLNGENLRINNYVFIAMSGILEILSYALPIPLLAWFGRKYNSLVLLVITGIALLLIMLVPKDMSFVILGVALIGRFCASAVFVILSLHTSELFPTSIRNTAIGTSHTVSQIGTIISPYLVEIGEANSGLLWWLPSTIFAILALLSALCMILLPETKNKPLFSTMEEMRMEERRKKAGTN